MKFIILACALASVVVADVSVVKSESVVDPYSFSYYYELDDGVKVSEEGKLKDPNTLAVSGQFGYTAPEGEHFQTSYIADENGFQPVGPHIPTPPPIPNLIQRGLDYIDTHPQPAH